MTISRPRATGFYAVFQNREYHATANGGMVILRSYRGEPDAPEFTPSRIPTVAGIRVVDRSELESLAFVKTVCLWRGEPFMIVGTDGEFAEVFYTGEQGEWAYQQPGLVRTGKLETHGRVALSEVSEIHEIVNPAAGPARSAAH